MGLKGQLDAGLIKAVLYNSLQNKTDYDYDVLKFFEHVLKFTPDMIPIPKDGYEFDWESCQAFIHGTWIKEDTPHGQKFTGERLCCDAFQRIVWHVARQIRLALSDNETPQNVLMFLEDKVVEGNFAKFKPDFGFGSLLFIWEFLMCIGEMKKTQMSMTTRALMRVASVSPDRILEVMFLAGNGSVIISLTLIVS